MLTSVAQYPGCVQCFARKFVSRRQLFSVIGVFDIAMQKLGKARFYCTTAKTSNCQHCQNLCAGLWHTLSCDAGERAARLRTLQNLNPRNGLVTFRSYEKTSDEIRRWAFVRKVVLKQHVLWQDVWQVTVITILRRCQYFSILPF